MTSTMLASSVSPHKPLERPMRIGSLLIDPQSRLVSVDGQPVKLAPMEYRLLRVLASAPTRVFTKAELLDGVWHWQPASHGVTRTLDVHAGRLRSKLGPDWVRAVWGVGYRLTDPAPEFHAGESCCPTCGRGVTA